MVLDNSKPILILWVAILNLFAQLSVPMVKYCLNKNSYKFNIKKNSDDI